LSTNLNCRPPTILVAEDDRADFLYLQHVLQNARTTLLRVADGEEALDYFKGVGIYGDRLTYPLPDVFLVDLGLPGISGHEVLEWLKTRPEYSGVRRIVLAGSSLNSDRTRAEKAGAEHYFIKPICLGHLALLFEKSTGTDLENISPGSASAVV
jgi:CheY-like chemotaxis protein